MAVKVGAGRSIQLGLGSKYAVEISGLMFWRAVKTGGCQDWRTPTSQKEGGWCKTKMIQIRVALPNAHEELLTLPPFSTVQDLKTKAQRAFGRKCLRLIDLIEEAEIKDGECLNALVLQPQLAATQRAFALWCHGDNAVVTWGDADFGGDSSAVRDQLRSVQQIQAHF